MSLSFAHNDIHKVLLIYLFLNYSGLLSQLTYPYFSWGMIPFYV